MSQHYTGRPGFPSQPAWTASAGLVIHRCPGLCCHPFCSWSLVYAFCILQEMLTWRADQLAAWQDLSSVYAACPELRTLRVSCCENPDPQCLSPLLQPAQQRTGQAPHAGSALPHLLELDVSYCSLPAQTVSDLLCFGPRLKVSLCQAHAV